MALENPMYIDAIARHRAGQVRLLDYAAVEGQEGILQGNHLGVVALSTPADFVDVLPGAYSVLATHLGGEMEAYLGKIKIAERVQVSPTTSSGSRTDLVILRIENPYVSGAGSWAQPADPVEGPYAHVRVVEGVPANTQTIKAYNNTWSAITLARITRPANTGVVQTAHITDLRSLAKLGGQRITVINNPPADPPPIAYDFFMDSQKAEPSGSNIVAYNQTTYKKFPNDITWKVPVPSWAKGMDVLLIVNPQCDGHVWGDARLVVEGVPTAVAPTPFDINYVNGTQPGPINSPVFIFGTQPVVPAWCGTTKSMWVEMKMLDPPNHPGKFTISKGTFATLILNFKRSPSYD